MNAVEQIKAEIKRRIKEDYNGPDQHDNEIAQGVCASLIAFLGTLPQEKPSEDLEKEINSFLNKVGAPVFWCNDDEQMEWCSVIARHFAEWQKDKMMEKAVKGYILSTLAERGSKVSVCSGYLPESLGIMCDDKVEIIIVKKD